MARNPTWRRRLAVPLLAGAAVALPLGLRGDGSAGWMEARAQTCDCFPSHNVCFVNGVVVPGTWEGA